MLSSIKLEILEAYIEHLEADLDEDHDPLDNQRGGYEKELLDIFHKASIKVWQHAQPASRVEEVWGHEEYLQYPCPGWITLPDGTEVWWTNPDVWGRQLLHTRKNYSGTVSWTECRDALRRSRQDSNDFIATLPGSSRVVQ